MTALSLPGERVPLPEGLTRLSDGSVRVDGADGVAVISPAAGAASRTVSRDVPPPVGADRDGYAGSGRGDAARGAR